MLLVSTTARMYLLLGQLVWHNASIQRSSDINFPVILLACNNESTALCSQHMYQVSLRFVSRLKCTFLPNHACGVASLTCPYYPCNHASKTAQACWHLYVGSPECSPILQAVHMSSLIAFSSRALHTSSLDCLL